MARTAIADTRPTPDQWTQNSVVILIICVLGWVFDVYEQTVMQIVTPILIKEFGISPSTMGSVTTIGRWVGLVGIFVFPALADLYGRKPILIISILGYSLFSGLTGFATGWISLLLLTSLNRVALSGELPVGMIMVTETAPTRWRASALSILNGGFPLGYMLCSLAAYFVVPLWGWRMLYFIGVIPALLVLWIRVSVKESPRFEHVSTTMVRD
ncbi:MAG: MFS transporter, partial [Pseudolabrys sp.]